MKGYEKQCILGPLFKLLEATFELTPDKKQDVLARMDDFLGRRKDKQPLEYPSAGSTFRRYEGRFTAKMIEDAGLKGVSVGGAMVSKKHAGFIINYNNATSDDIFRLIQKVKDVIFEKSPLEILASEGELNAYKHNRGELKGK